MGECTVEFSYSPGVGIIMSIDEEQRTIFDMEQAQAFYDALDRCLLPDEDDCNEGQLFAWDSLGLAITAMKRQEE